MPRLIDAEALDAKLEKLMWRYAKQGRERVAEDYNFVRTVLSTGPTIDPESLRPHGRWVDNHCTACGKTPLGEELWEHLDVEPPRFELCFPICPNCGAKMDEEEHND